MSQFVDGFVCAVPEANKDIYRKLAQEASQIFKEYGALSVVECWESDVPDGKFTSFPMAVKREPGEAIVFAWIVWPSKEVRDHGHELAMKDPRMDAKTDPRPFDGKRMIYGGFDLIISLEPANGHRDLTHRPLHHPSCAN